MNDSPSKAGIRSNLFWIQCLIQSLCTLTSQYIDEFQTIFVISLSAALCFSFTFPPRITWLVYPSQLSLQRATYWNKQNYTTAIHTNRMKDLLNLLSSGYGSFVFDFAWQKKRAFIRFACAIQEMCDPSFTSVPFIDYNHFPVN